MLHFVYALREKGIKTEYGSWFARSALRGFLKEIDKDEEFYLEIVRAAAAAMYHAALESTGKQYFLDKTPRYYFIIPELYKIFPQARFVFLIRNPLAVFASILSVSLEGRWRNFRWEDRRHDIMTAPRLMLEGIAAVKQRSAVVHYEKLVSAPERAVQNLCAGLGLPYDPDMLNYGGKVRLTGAFVDPKSIHRHSRPVPDYAARWSESLDTPAKVQMASVYLQLLGRGTVEALGYSYEELKESLDAIPVKRLKPQLPWEKLLLGEKRRFSWWGRIKLSWLERQAKRQRPLLREHADPEAR